ncbi:hypothetical protein PHLCEN_2v1308 [Hermanssonia centrifuga]|uniref:Chromatin target of PRMT1 protein C-terminal domain-containing protein n=1 Tax=Hermanssonia centrifuga TaxID=98765 RepID=A0A2R6S3M0_9APHY|nr:hypothetical protein PHLCEN_2v1308 [Hermanssonia centrifuga]
MDIVPEPIVADDTTVPTLSYDESVPYSDQLPVDTLNEPGQSSLANRIGSTKVYLISDATAARSGKVRWRNVFVGAIEDLLRKDNAILFNGSPISHLPTTNIFAYATHFDAHPIALEWIDDCTCILIFSTKTAARAAFRFLAKSHAEEPSDEGFITSKPIPVAIWPPKKRVDQSLGVDEGLKGAIRMRWALTTDVKKRGAKKESEFYKRYGTGTGKDPANGDEERPNKKRRGDAEDINEAQRAQLDEDLDNFLAEDDSVPSRPPSPPSKMRSDYINAKGKTLLERTSALRQQPVPLEARIASGLPRRARREQQPRKTRGLEERMGGSLSERLGGESSRRRRSREPRARRERPNATQEDLDAELDAFLNSKD